MPWQIAHIPWLFFLVSLTFALVTLNVYWPLRRPAPIAVASFFAGWLTSELVGHAIALQIIIASFFIIEGGFSTWPDWIAAGITACSCAFLVRSLESARRAGKVVDAALREGLGEDYAARIDPALRELPPLRFGLRQLAFFFRIKHPEVERVANIVYSEGERHRLHLDVYRHKSRPKKRPTLLQIHGGGWVLGNKNQQGLPIVTHFASRGWVCVSANYRLSPRATFPDPLVDLKYALKWIKEHGEEYGCDPDFIVVTGGSAGGHLAAMLALTANLAEYQPGFEDVDTAVRACIAFYGIYDFTDRNKVWPHSGLLRLLERTVLKANFERERERFEKASPIGHASDRAPPFLVVHGDLDTMVPVDEARHFVKVLREKSKAPVVYAEVPGAQHAFEVFPSLRTSLVLAGVETFLNTIYAASRAEAALPLPTTPGDGIVLAPVAADPRQEGMRPGAGA